MIIDALNIPCPDCMARLEAELLVIEVSNRGTMRSIFCPSRQVALTTVVRQGVTVWWQLWPCASAEELHQQLAGVEASMTIAAVSEAVSAPKH